MRAVSVCGWGWGWLSGNSSMSIGQHQRQQVVKQSRKHGHLQATRKLDQFINPVRKRCRRFIAAVRRSDSSSATCFEIRANYVINLHCDCHGVAVAKMPKRINKRMQVLPLIWLIDTYRARYRYRYRSAQTYIGQPLSHATYD